MLEKNLGVPVPMAIPLAIDPMRPDIMPPPCWGMAGGGGAAAGAGGGGMGLRAGGGGGGAERVGAARGEELVRAPERRGILDAVGIGLCDVV